MARSRISAGILLFRRRSGQLEFFLVHPGGPFWAKKDEGAWSIPKGETDPVGGGSGSSSDEEELLDVAKREFHEETSFRIEDCATGDFMELSPVKQKNGKTVYAWAVEGDIDAEKISSNTCMIEWPPRSGKQMEIPEVDRGEWFTEEEAKKKINEGQRALIEEVLR